MAGLQGCRWRSTGPDYSLRRPTLDSLLPTPAIPCVKCTMHSGNCDYSQVSALVPAHGILSAPNGAEDTDEPAWSQFSTRRDARLAAKLVAAKVAAERERCAGVAEARVFMGSRLDAEQESYNLACECIAATIRAIK